MSGTTLGSARALFEWDDFGTSVERPRSVAALFTGEIRPLRWNDLWNDCWNALSKGVVPFHSFTGGAGGGTIGRRKA
jgi:hypothetical protein